MYSGIGNINTHLHVVYAMFVEPSQALLLIRELIYYIGPNHFPYQLKLSKQYVNIEYICQVRFDQDYSPFTNPGNRPLIMCQFAAWARNISYDKYNKKNKNHSNNNCDKGRFGKHIEYYICLYIVQGIFEILNGKFLADNLSGACVVSDHLRHHLRDQRNGSITSEIWTLQFLANFGTVNRLSKKEKYKIADVKQTKKSSKTKTDKERQRERERERNNNNNMEAPALHA